MYQRVLLSPRLYLAWNLLKEYAPWPPSSLSSRHLMCYVFSLPESEVASLATEYTSAVHNLVFSQEQGLAVLSSHLTTILREAERRYELCGSSDAFESWCSTTDGAQQRTRESSSPTMRFTGASTMPSGGHCGDPE